MSVFMSEKTRAKCYHVLGGNQSNSVSIARIPKERLIAARRPPYELMLKVAEKNLSNGKGSISLNEA